MKEIVVCYQSLVLKRQYQSSIFVQGIFSSGYFFVSKITCCTRNLKLYQDHTRSSRNFKLLSSNLFCYELTINICRWSKDCQEQLECNLLGHSISNFYSKSVFGCVYVFVRKQIVT